MKTLIYIMVLLLTLGCSSQIDNHQKNKPLFAAKIEKEYYCVKDGYIFTFDYTNKKNNITNSNRDIMSTGAQQIGTSIKNCKMK